MNECLSTGRSIYRLFDSEPAPHGCHIVDSWPEAHMWNEKKWGIYWTVNEFDGPRQNKNLKRIISWAVDIDDGTKLAQRETIKKFPTPTVIVETKRGYQIYFHTDDATVENHKEIQDRLVTAYGGDSNAKDIARILRVPFHAHWKNINDPFMVLVKHTSRNKYSEKEMMNFFLKPADEKRHEQKKQIRQELKFLNDENLFDRIYSMDCEQAMLIVSGHECVGGERYTFRRNANGNLNLIVNGKGSSVFLDKQKRIGSSDQGGPTIFQWINWFQRDHKKTYQYFKNLFPEVISGHRKI